MDPNQQQLLLTGGAKDKVYIDEVFNTQAYIGTGSERTITTGIDLAGEGGLLWFKNRDNSNQANYLLDTTTLPQTSSPWYSYPMFSNSTTARGASANGLKSFNSDGFTIQSDTHCNGSGNRQVAWSFRKAPAFFDIVQYNGDGNSARDIAHNLGCVPGMIITKRTDQAGHWWTYHKNLGRATADWAKVARLDTTDGQIDSQYCLGATSHQNASTFRVGNDNSMNSTGASYVAYLFAGGESTAATAKSVYFDGTDDTLTLGSSPTPSYDDFHMTGDFTIESWIYPTDWSNAYSGLWGLGQYNDPGGIFFGVVGSSGKLDMQKANNTGGGYNTPFSVTAPPAKQWTHVALVRAGSTITVYYNGTAKGSWTDSTDWGTSTNKCFNVGSVRNGSGNNVDFFKGQISNMRVVKGTAVYTASFIPSTTPLTNITNTKLLCCNNSSATGSTVTPGTITAVSSPTVFTENPFLDPDGFKFGEGGNQNVVQCGSYLGNTTTAPEIYLGWEPQLIIFKNKSASGNWSLFDSMRGIRTGPNGDEHYLYPNLENSEYTAERIELMPRGFRVDTGAGTLINTSGEEYIYIAIRRADSLVGKPPEAGTDVFAMDVGNASSTIPAYDSGFVVDMGIDRYTNSSNPWWLSTRLTSGNYLRTNTSNPQTNDANYPFDSNVGYVKGSWANSSAQAWMWRRYAGLDVVTYEGVGGGRIVPHGLGKVPEMIWIKNRDYSSGEPWTVGHFGMNGGTNPWQYWMSLNNTDAEQSNSGSFNNTAPTATHFSVGTDRRVDFSGNNYQAILFATVPGISKLGYYAGQNTNKTIDLGFTPRFFMCKARTQSQSTFWAVFDSLRGISSGTTPRLSLNSSSGNDNGTFVSVTGSTITLNTGYYYHNEVGYNYIYYAHA